MSIKEDTNDLNTLYTMMCFLVDQNFDLILRHSYPISGSRELTVIPDYFIAGELTKFVIVLSNEDRATGTIHYVKEDNKFIVSYLSHSLGAIEIKEIPWAEKAWKGPKIALDYLSSHIPQPNKEHVTTDEGLSLETIFNVDGKATYTFKMIVKDIVRSITKFDQKDIPNFGSLITVQNLAVGENQDTPTHVVETYRGGLDDFQYKVGHIKDKQGKLVATLTPVPGCKIRVRTQFYDGSFMLNGFHAVPYSTISKIIFGK